MADNIVETKKSSSWNVIDEATFKSRIRDVFDRVSSALTNTLGPYGSTTIIEQYGDMHITKDGWQVLKNIRFDDPIDNNIIMLLVRISAQVVIKVGDGSTSSIVAAHELLNTLDDNMDLFPDMRPKEIIDLMKKCVSCIADRIYANAHKINMDSFEEIEKLARISTNGDETISSMITEIYQKTHNPVIEYAKSKNGLTYYEIIDGYGSNISYIDPIFVTDDDGNCVIKNPMFLMFDYKITLETDLYIISAAANIAAADNRRLVVIAPNYDKFLSNRIGHDVSMEFKTRGTSVCVYTRVPLVNAISRETYNDFAVMAGATVIHEQFVDTIVNISDTTEVMNWVEPYLGGTEMVSIGAKTTTISGFTNRVDTLYDKIVADANRKYIECEQENRNKGIVDMRLTELKNRVTKLKGIMGVIYVGGNSTLEQDATYDLVEDAVKACESAYTHGYNCGGNLIIPKTIDTILDSNESDHLTDEEKSMYALLQTAFICVFRAVLTNKFGNDDAASLTMSIITDECLLPDDDLTCYDVTTNLYSSSIINSCMTDIEILKAAVSIVSLLLTSNQYISIESPR